MEAKRDKENILHIFVIGFHHKKGCQVEFCYPALDPFPESWKNLPSLAMPDGAHNFTHDSVYFHLPSLSKPLQTVFGVSCFQQIPLEKVKNRTEDMTRSTVQKAVCVLANAPLYGYIHIKMELVTAAFFDEADFSKTKILEDAFHHLRDCLPGCSEQHLFDGLSVRHLLSRFHHRLLVLYKLLLLEKKIIVFQSPVQPLCSNILSLVSLMPASLESDLFEAVSHSQSGSPVRMTYGSNQPSDILPECAKTGTNKCNSQVVDNQSCIELLTNYSDPNGGHKDEKRAVHDNKYALNDRSCVESNMQKLMGINLAECGLPLEVFKKGNTCHPYLSISYLDLLGDPAVRGFLAGATNVLFKQKRSLWEVLVEVDEGRIETSCPELSRTLALTTEDLRFMDTVLQGALDPQYPADDEWIRRHFYLYLTSFLRASLLPEGSREVESFNASFVESWRLTHNGKLWASTNHSGILHLDPVHPGTGAMSVNDVKLRISQAMMSSESGRKINRAVANTGKVVGGAVTQAKGAISGWWNSFAQDNKTVKAVDHI